MRAWVGDGPVELAAARVSVFDRGFRTGEGVFESLRAYAGHPFRLAAHLERAAAGAAVLGFDLPDPELLERALRETARTNHGEHDCGLRLTVTPGEVDPEDPFVPAPGAEPTVIVTSFAIRYHDDLYRHGVSATFVPWSREVPQVKALSYLAATLARRTAREQGADEALLTDPDGMVLEGSYSNVFAVTGGRVTTPPLGVGILAGVTRAVTLEVADALGVAVDERPLSADELTGADEAFLTSSTRELVPLVRVAGRDIAGGTPGPLTAALHEAYRDEVRREMQG